MMKRTNWLMLFLVICLAAGAQERLILAGTPRAQYVSFTVGAETTLKTVSNHFGQSAARLAAFNKINVNTALEKGTVIKIPVTNYNLLRARISDKNVPVYHVVVKGENLFRLSKSHGVTVANLREWNKLKADAVKVGEPLIVAFMANVKAGDLFMAENKKAENRKVTDEAVQTAITPAVTPKIVEASKKAAEQKDVVAVPAKQPGLKEAAAPMAVPVAAAAVPKIEANKEYVPREGDEGYFAAGYASHPKEKAPQFHSGDAATFKSISGWTDRKYYVLINELAPETIVRITAPNNKSVCAKVLGPLQETKGGSGLLLRMSNSAASALGITDPKFTITVTYFE